VINEDALTAAHKAVEDVLVELRDRRISVLNRGNGFVCREYDGQESSIMRLGTRDGLRIGIQAYLAHLADPDLPGHLERTQHGKEARP
jgi:hypothetical protein